MWLGGFLWPLLVTKPSCRSGSVTREGEIELHVTPQYQRYGTHGAMGSRDSTHAPSLAEFGPDSGFGLVVFPEFRFGSVSVLVLEVRILIDFGTARFGL